MFDAPADVTSAHRLKVVIDRRRPACRTAQSSPDARMSRFEG